MAEQEEIALEKSQPNVIYIDCLIFEVNADLLREAIQITPKDSDHPFIDPPSKKEIISFNNKLGYFERLTRISDMATNNLYQPWRTFITMINRCLTGVEVDVERVSIPKRRHSKIVIGETGQSGELAKIVYSKETKDKEEELLIRRRPTNVVIDLKKVRKASKDDFIIQQCPKGSGEGSGVALEVPDGLSLKGPNEGSSVTLAVLDEPSDNLSSSSSESEFEDIFSDDESDGADDKEKAVDSMIVGDKKVAEEQADEEKAGEEQHTDDHRVQAYLKNILPTDVPVFGKIKLQKAAKQACQTTPLNHLMKLLSQNMIRRTSYPPTQKKRRRDNQDQDPFADSVKEKKRKQKDFESTNKDKDQAGSSRKGKSPSKSFKTDKSVHVEETVHDVEMEVGESIKEDVVDVEDPSQADASVPKCDKSTWFKTDVIKRPESPNLEWHKEPTVDDALE
ncbi:hypothetical protein Tco_0158273 [Tanacetum coccineum]